MKFDVVLSNPPYQSASSKHTKLWFEFLKLSLSITTEHVVFVAPSVWMSGQSSVAKKTRTLINGYSLNYVNVTANNFFMVGENICAFQIDIKIITL